MARTPRTHELTQRVADAHLDLAQQLEAIAKGLRKDAKHYRAGELLTAYTGLSTIEHATELEHPAARAIQNLANVRYSVQAHIDRNTSELQAVR